MNSPHPDRMKLVLQSYALYRSLKLHHTCVTCEHFADECCTLVQPPARPPAAVIVEGCASYEECIPF
jgi:hypothetical protein